MLFDPDDLAVDAAYSLRDRHRLHQFPRFIAVHLKSFRFNVIFWFFLMPYKVGKQTTVYRTGSHSR